MFTTIDVFGDCNSFKVSSFKQPIVVIWRIIKATPVNPREIFELVEIDYRFIIEYRVCCCFTFLLRCNVIISNCGKVSYRIAACCGVIGYSCIVERSEHGWIAFCRDNQIPLKTELVKVAVIIVTEINVIRFPYERNVPFRERAFCTQVIGYLIKCLYVFSHICSVDRLIDVCYFPIIT